MGNNRPELMSPAGDWEALRAAVANGADAVYFGMDNFNARHRAANFTRKSLGEVMAYLHRHNVKGYLTFNVLMFSDELEEAVALVKEMVAARVDAVIVQDLGVARLIQRLAPGLAVHGSTQMTLTEPRAIEWLRETVNLQRVVLARELSAKDVSTIAQQTATPVEVFIHGALCVAYSGQCLTSEAMGGRSANRGQCAQACRLPYDLIVDGAQKDLGDKAYLLSPQDLAAYDMVEDLVKAGVSCFKIEGRLKSAPYVAATTQTYRAALDAAIAHRAFAIDDQQKRNLAQIFSRGFTHGFLDGIDHAELVPALFPKSRGIRIGSVIEVTRRGVIVQVDSVSTNGRMRLDARQHPLKPGDGVVFDQGLPEDQEQGGRIYEIFPARGKGLELAFGRGDVELKSIAVGAVVWKTDDPEVRRRLEQSYGRDEVARRVPVTAKIIAKVGEPLSLRLIDEHGRSGIARSEQRLELARKHPATVESLREQVSRLGDTPFELTDLRVEPLEAVMVPKSLLNDLRRQAAAELVQARESAAGVQVVEGDALEQLRAAAGGISVEGGEVSMSVLCRTLEQVEALAKWRPEIPLSTVYCDFEDPKRYKAAVPIAKEHGLEIALATTRIIKPGEEGLLRLVASAEPDAILVRNLAGLCFYRAENPGLRLIGDYSLNVANELTAAMLHEAGLERLVPGYDLNWKQMSAMLGRISPGLFECVIHQHMPMFHMEHCVFCHTLSNGHDHRDCGRPCDIHKVDLRDRTGKQHPLIADVGCRNTVYNATPQSAGELVPAMKVLGVRRFRVELLRETGEQMRELLARYAELISGRTEARQAVRSLNVLNQLGVTRGTFGYE